MNALILAIVIAHPSKLLTVPTAHNPESYQISIFNAGVKIGNLFFRIDPVLLTALMNTGFKLSMSGFFVSVNVSKFYGDRFVQKESVDRIKLDASGYNLSAGYTFKNLTGAFYIRNYGGTSSVGISAGLFINPVMAEVGYDGFEQIRSGAGVFLSSGGFFVKIGAYSSTRLLKDGKFYVVPVINIGYRK